MKKIFWLLAAPIVITSCKKDSDSTPTPAPSSSACIMTEERDSVGNALQYSYEYDASKRITKLTEYSAGIKSGYSTFTYAGSTITQQNFRKDNSSKGSAVATLNSSGYVSLNIGISSDTIDNEPVTTKDTSNFTYNSSGQLTGYSLKAWSRNAGGEIKSQFVQTVTHEYTSGRVSKRISSITSGGATPFTLTFTDVFTYDAASPTVKYNPVVGLNSEAGEYFGKLTSDKIPSKIESTSDFGSGTQIISTVVDSKGYPSKIRVAGVADATTTLYTYSCP